MSSLRVPGGVVHTLPEDLRQALIANHTALVAWKDITPLARNEFICWVEDAKQKMTRERRIRRTQEELEEGQRRPCCWPGCKHRERTGHQSMGGSTARIDPELRRSYLGRLGLEVEPPTVEALQRLHRRHAERIPYETMWLHAGEAWGINPVDSAARIALRGRGGYCYHLNGAFAELLQSLGYAVHRHVGGVHGASGPDASAAGNHLVLTVSSLPSDRNAGGVWYVDVGLADALHEPLSLVPGNYIQAPFHLSLDETDVGVGGWHLSHDPAGGFVGMSWTMAEAEMPAFVAKHQWLSTSPDSQFLQVAMAERRDATGVDVIRGLVLTRIGDRAASSEPLEERSEWFEALAEVFDLRFDGTAPEILDHLWDKVLATHHVWDAAGRP